MPLTRTVVISCAGIGSRLGLHTNKSLIDICGKPLILRQLALLDQIEDVRLVLGYQAEKIIDVVRTYRKDVLFVFNHDYLTTRTAASLCMGKRFAKELIISLDGDILFDPKDFENFVFGSDENAIGVCMPYSDEPVFVSTKMLGGEEFCTALTREPDKYEWTGAFRIHSKELGVGCDHVYKMITPNLPMRPVYVNAREIDNMEEYEKACQWFQASYLNLPAGQEA